MHRFREHTYDCQRGRMRRRIIRESGINMYTSLYLKLITNKDSLYGSRNSAQCYVVVWMGGNFMGRMDTCLCMAESLLCSPETTTTLLISYTPVQNKKFKKISPSYHSLESSIYFCLIQKCLQILKAGRQLCNHDRPGSFNILSWSPKMLFQFWPPHLTSS